MCLFFGKLYHGRYPNNTKSNLAIMMSFFPVGSHFYVKKTPKPMLENMGPELRRLLDPDANLKYLMDGKVEVINNNNEDYL